MNLDKIDKELLKEVALFHSIPEGAVNIRKNGEGVYRTSSAEIEITPKKEKSGIDIFVKPGIKNKSVHIPVIISKGGINDLVYNDFYIGEGADCLIVAGCGIHNDTALSSQHNGIHTFHIGKNAKVKYVERHLGVGNGAEKILNPTTEILMESGSSFEMETIQLGGVSSAIRKTTATLQDNAKLVIKEKIKTDENQTAKTDFTVHLKGKNSSAKLLSRSVASGKSYQEFRSNLIGENECFGHVECDGLLTENARIASLPQIDAKNSNAQLVHEAQIGKIAGEQLTKLTTLGLTPKEAEHFIIKAYVK
ncbi:MAG: SufD family Fe-S cluster assembly protein [Clostridia bacterium]|nr:SufD family Fe-S cluster assembly protein [Clostridia bacterium]